MAIEPQVRLHMIIERNIALNKLSNVILDGRAISDTQDESRIFLTSTMNSGNSGLSQGTRYKLRTQSVQLARLRDVLNDHAIHEVDCLKVDIEGWEYEAILGSPELFTKGHIKALILEVHPVQIEARHKDLNDITSFLASAGYRKEEFGCCQV